MHLRILLETAVSAVCYNQGAIRNGSENLISFPCSDVVNYTSKLKLISKAL